MEGIHAIFLYTLIKADPNSKPRGKEKCMEDLLCFSFTAVLTFSYRAPLLQRNSQFPPVLFLI